MSDKLTSRIICGDAAKVLRTFAAETIPLTITSPPYGNIRKYNGFVFDFERVAEELYRITTNGGCLAWVVSDKYENYSDSLESFVQALFFKSLGFCVRLVIIEKRQIPPFNHKTQLFYPPAFEFLFICSKGKPGTFNPLRDRVNKYPGKFEPTLSTKRNTEGAATSHIRNWIVPENSLRSTVWQYNVGRHHSTRDEEAFEHPAIFPESLASDIISSWSNEGDTVLDPFVGSGTAGKMAIINKRNFIGVDISSEYCELAKTRINRALGIPYDLPKRTSNSAPMPLFEGYSYAEGK